MKAAVIILFAIIASIECKRYVQINKNANVDFINMEAGGLRPGNAPVVPAGGPGQQPPTNPKPEPAKPQTPITQPVPPVKPPVNPPVTPTQAPTPKPQVPVKPTVTPVVTIKPSIHSSVHSNQMDLKPVAKQPQASGSVTTPGPGTVKQLVTFYDTKGKASNIRPYSYSQAVKQGK